MDTRSISIDTARSVPIPPDHGRNAYYCVVLDKCDEFSWPDNDLRSRTCGDCKILANNMGTHRTCSNYCWLVGRKCTGAWEEVEDTCEEQSTEACHNDFGTYTSDAICECGLTGDFPYVSDKE